MKKVMNGYKLLSRLYTGTDFQILSYNMGLRYHLQDITKREPNCGPLSLFARRLTALNYLLDDHWTEVDAIPSMLERVVDGRYVLGKCIYTPSKDNYLWHGENECHYFPRTTKFADTIIVLSVEKLDIEELKVLAAKIQEKQENLPWD